MRPIEILQQRVAAKLAELNVSAREISMAATGKDGAVRNILAKGAMPGIDRLDAIAAELGTTSDWLLGREGAIEATGGGAARVSETILRRLPKTLPVYGSALGADMEYDDEHGVVVKVEQTEVHMVEAIDQMARPTGIAGRPDMYVVIVSGHSMEPRYDSGRRVLVDGKRQPVVGDDVIVQLRGAIDGGEEVTHVLIKRFVRRRAGVIVLQQFNPHQVFEVPDAQVKAVHRVMPWDEALGF